MRYDLKARLLRLWHDEGGWITAALGAISGLGSLFGGGAKAAADSRMQQAMLQMQQDRARTDQYGIAQGAQFQQANTDLARKHFEEDARGGRAKQAMLADLLANFQPTSINVPGIESASISGGLKLGEGGKMAASELMKQALMKQLAGDQFEGGQILPQPGVQATPKAGWLEKTGGILGTLGAIAGGIKGILPQGAPSVPGIPGAQAGMPGQMPGTSVGLGGLPEPPPLTPEIIAQINAIANSSRGMR